MKRLIWYILCIFVLGSMFSACYYLSYKSALNKLKQQERKQELNLMLDIEGRRAAEMFAALAGLTSNKEENENIVLQTADKQTSYEADAVGLSLEDGTGKTEEDAVLADAVAEPCILPKTKILIESFEVTTGEFTTEEKQPDAVLIGMTREQLAEYLARELDNMPMTEYEKGLYVNELITFSENKVIIRKTYDMDRVNFLYYLAVKNGEVVVYYSDLKTVYEYTGIRAIDLAEEERLQLLEGIRIETAEELFSLLESYSS